MSIFISKPHVGWIFIAERSRKGSRKLLWSVMPEVVDPNNGAAGADVRIEARCVPLRIRRQAYRVLTTSEAPLPCRTTGPILKNFNKNGKSPHGHETQTQTEPRFHQEQHDR